MKAGGFNHRIIKLGLHENAYRLFWFEIILSGCIVFYLKLNDLLVLENGSSSIWMVATKNIHIIVVDI